MIPVVPRPTRLGEVSLGVHGRASSFEARRSLRGLLMVAES